MHDFPGRRGNGSQKSRLDVIWISSELVSNVTAVKILPFLSSDYSSVYICFSIPAAPERGRGVWKLNTSVLKDDVFCAEIRAFWNSWQKEKPTISSLDIWWKAGERRLKSLSKRISRQKVSSRRSQTAVLERTLKDLVDRENQGEDVATSIRDTKDLLAQEHLHRAQGAKIRAKQQ